MQRLIKEIYIHHDSRRGVKKTYKWLLSEVEELGVALNRGDSTSISEEAADVLAWLLSVMNLLDLDLEKAFIDKYGGRCPRCGGKPCRCPYREEP